jgi:hypothetical protein
LQINITGTLFSSVCYLTTHIYRYGKNLKIYYDEWKSLSKPRDNFWKWLNKDNVELAACPRSRLDYDRVHYCTLEERKNYIVDIVGGMVHRSQDIVDTGPEGWIFVLRDDTLYANPKVTDSVPRFIGVINTYTVVILLC